MKYTLISLGALSTALATSDAAAQNAPDDPGKVVLEEIVVTADRSGFGANLVQVGTFRNARIIDVPLTVNVVPSELLNSQAAAGLFDALRNTAGVSRAQVSGATYDNVAIRGILVENRSSYRLNGSLAVVNLVDLPIENKERIEVLKGVGALYYGYAPPSGIVNMVSKRPTSDLIRLSASWNEHGGAYAAADVSRRFSDAFGIRLNGAYGLIEPGIDRFEGTRYMASAAVDLDVTDDLSLKFDFEHINKDVTEPSVITAQLVSPGVRVLTPLPDPSLNLGGKDLRYDAYGTSFLGRADYRLSSQFALTVEAGQSLTVRDRTLSNFQNYNLTPTSPFYGNGTLNITRTAGQRFRNRTLRAELAGAFSTGPLIHNLIVGATSFWRYQNGRNSTAVTATQNYFEPREIQVAEPTIFTNAPVEIRDRGIYVVDRAILGPVELLAGARYSDYRNVSTSVAGIETRYEVTKWTPSVGVILKPTKSLSIYTTYLQGLEETPPAPLLAANPNAVLPPATSTQYEVGFKGEVLKAVTFQIAGFQISRPSAFVDPTDNFYKLAGRARYRGIEASFSGEVTPRLSVYLSGQYLDAEVTNAVPATLIGKTPENTPEWTASLYTEYRPEIVDGLAIGGGAFYVSERAVNPLNELFIDGYTTWSASLRYTLPRNENVTFQLNADNLTNKRYWAGAGNNLASYGMPRIVKFTTRISF